MERREAQKKCTQDIFECAYILPICGLPLNQISSSFFDETYKFNQMFEDRSGLSCGHGKMYKRYTFGNLALLLGTRRGLKKVKACFEF